MNKKLFLQILVVLSFTYIQTQAASFESKSQPQTPVVVNSTAPNLTPVKPFFGTAPTPTVNPPATLPAPILPTAFPTLPAPSNPGNSKPMQKSLEQARRYISKQIKDGKTPANIKTDGISESDISKLLLPIQNDTTSSVFIGFENNMGGLSEIPGAGSSPKNRIQIPAQCNYLIYNSNNPTGKALNLSYQSNENDTSAQPNIFQSCEVKNGSAYNKKSSQAFIGTAYISIDPTNTTNLILFGKTN